jgi:predicted phosphoribosyltransferase
MSLDVAADYLKPIAVRKIVVATPLASIAATDRMHILADQIFCLSILENYFGTDHYYDDNTIPDHKTVVEIMKNIVYSW